MANTSITMDNLRQIIRLKSEGTSKRKISQLLSIHRETVRKYVEQMEALGIDYGTLLQESDADLHLIFEKHQFVKTDIARFNELRNFFPYAQKELGKTGVDRFNLWTEYKDTHSQYYTYSHFCREYNRWAKTQQTSAHFEYKAGEKMFIDYTGKKLSIVNKETGEFILVEVFVAILGFSNYIYVEATASQKKEDFLPATENALHFFGGVPQAIVPDNLKSAVTKGCKYEPRLNETYEGFAVHYGTTILPTRPHEPQDKSLVEGAVKWIYKRVFAPLRNMTFFSLGELNMEIKRLMVLANAMSFQIKEHSRTILFNEIERSALRALPDQRYEYKSFRWLTVQKNSHVYLSEDKNYYSVHHQYNGQKVKVAYSSTLVEVLFNHERIAVHPRSRIVSKYSTNKEHMASNSTFMSEWSPEFFTSWASGIGEATRAFIEKVLSSKAHPEQGYKSALGILNLAKKKDVGTERLNNACSRALCYGDYTYPRVKSIIDKRLDIAPVEMELPFTLPVHENIRGQQYYQ